MLSSSRFFGSFRLRQTNSKRAETRSGICSVENGVGTEKCEVHPAAPTVASWDVLTIKALGYHFASLSRPCIATRGVPEILFNDFWRLTIRPFRNHAN